MYTFKYYDVSIMTWQTILYISNTHPLRQYHSFAIQLKVRLQPNIRFTLRHVLAVFTHSPITPPKVSRFGRNLEHFKYIVGGWPWQILGTICTVARAGEQGEIVFCQVSDAPFHWFPVSQISKIWMEHVDWCHDENFRNRILKILP